MGRIITVISGKGGVGKSTFSANTAAALSKIGQKVLLVDADINLGNLDVMMGIQDRVIFNAYDVALGRCTVEKARITDICPRIDFLSCAINTFDIKEEVKFKIYSIIKSLKNNYDIILIDCPSGIDREVKAAIEISDTSIIITTPDTTAIRDAGKAAMLTYGKNTNNVRLVVNRVRPKLIEKQLAPDIDEIIDNTEVQLIGLIPEDVNIQIDSNKGKITFFSKKSYSGKAFENIASRIIGKEIPLYKFWK